MIYQELDLKQLYPEALEHAPETPFVRYSPDNSPEIAIDLRPAVIVCPGGGYVMTSDREAESVALEFLKEGFHAFVLRYATTPHCYPVQLSQAAAAVRYLRQNAAELKVDPAHIAVLGFSAGGHEAASIAVLSNEAALLERFGAQPGELTPNAAVLCYPVITNKFYKHQDSLVNVSGGDEKLAEYLSLEDRVDEHTPPTFLWHTYEDSCVDVRNSLGFAVACKEHGVPFELHVFERGAHGLSLCDDRTKSPVWAQGENIRAGAWLGLCIGWLKERGFRF